MKASVFIVILIVIFFSSCTQTDDRKYGKKYFQYGTFIKKSGWTVPFSSKKGMASESVSLPREDGTMTPVTMSAYGDRGRLYKEETSTDPTERHELADGFMSLRYVTEFKVGENIFMFKIIAQKPTLDEKSGRYKIDEDEETRRSYFIRDADGDGIFETLLPDGFTMIVPDWALTKKEPPQITYSPEMGSTNEQIDPIDSPHTTKFLREHSALLKIKNLRDTKLPPQTTEIRMWDVGEIIKPQCLIIRNENGKRSAKMVNASGKKNAYVARPLPEPEIGWEKFEDHLASEGIRYPLEYSYEEYPVIMHHAGELVIEIKTDAGYDICVYNDYKKDKYYDEKAKRFAAVVRFIREQFKRAS